MRTSLVYFDCVNWLSGTLSLLLDSNFVEIDGNVTRYHMAQRIDGYTIEVSATDWYIYVASCLFLSGHADSIDDAKTKAFDAMDNYLRGHSA